MSDNNNTKKQEELDAILSEFLGGDDASASSEAAPAKEWSLSDIDKLIADAGGEADASQESGQQSAEEKLAKFFEPDYNSDLFTVQPIKEEEPVYEDIYSGAEEVDGQEMLYPDEEEFDIDSFELEAIEISDDEPEDIFSSAFQQDAAEKKEEEAPVEEAAPEEKIVDYRERFFKKLTLEDIGYVPEEENDPEGPVDKSGTVLFKNPDGTTESDLDPMPTVKAAEDVKAFEEEMTKIADSGEKPAAVKEEKSDNDVEGQMVLKGFQDIPDEAAPDKESEIDVEGTLLKKRKQKAKEFKVENLEGFDYDEDFDNMSREADEFVAPEEEIKEEDDDVSISMLDSIGEYNDITDRNRIHSKLASLVKKTSSGVIVVGIIEAVALLLAILPPLADRLSIETSLFVKDSVILCVLNAVMIIAAVAFDSDRFFDAVTGIFKGRFTGDTAGVICVAAAIIENTLSAITKAQTPVFGVIAITGILINKISDAITARRVYGNFQVCAFNYDHNMYAVHKFENENEIFELGRGLLMGNADLLYSSSVEFPSNFIKNSGEEGEAAKSIRLMMLISAVLSFIAGIVIGIKQGSLMAGIAGFTAGLCLSMPVFGKFIPSFISFIHNRKLNHEGTMIVSLDEAEKIAAANAVVLDSADIFDGRSCTMHGMKDFHSMRIDTVLLYAAAMVIKSGGPLKECFEEVVDGRQDLLPPVRELVYEDKLGISARIYEQKALLGNRNMLIHHNIDAPDKALEDKYSKNGRKVIYLAVNEKLAALFVVSYRVDEEMKNYLRQLEKNGIQILVRTNDVNVTEELISERFNLNTSDFKILSSVAGRLFKRRKDAVSETLDAGVIHDGSHRSMLKAIASCCAMATRKKLCGILQFALMAMGLLLTLLIGIGENGMTTLAAAGVMLLEIIAAVAAVFPFNLIKKDR